MNSEKSNHPVDLVNPVRKESGTMDPILDRINMIHRMKDAQFTESAGLKMSTKANLEGLQL